MLSKMNGHLKSFDETEKYNEIWGKVNNIIKKAFDTDLLHYYTMRNIQKAKQNYMITKSIQTFMVAKYLKMFPNVFVYQLY